MSEFSLTKQDALSKSGGKLDAALRGGFDVSLASNDGVGAAVRAGKVAVELLLYAGADEWSARAALEAAGMSGLAISGRAASGWIDAGAVDALEAVEALQFARPAYYVTNAGSFGGEGSLAINADAGRTTENVDGTGVGVGVLSDSFNALNGAAADQASGDLPTVNVLQDSGGTDEGRAMAQIVHDVAPGADILFHTANGGQAAFAQGIRDLATAGADVIVDDIVYLAEPFFQDGLIVRAIDDVAAQGVAYFTSAGNSARNSYESVARSSGQDLVLQGNNGPINFGDMHDFDPDAGVDVRQQVTVSQGQTLILSFQWDQPFGSLSQTNSSASDYDIFLFGSGGALEASNVVAASTNNNVNGDPVEIFQFTNNTASTQFDIVITRFSGPVAGQLKYINVRGGNIVEFDTNSDTTFGHAQAEGGLGIGAAFYGFTPNFGQSPPLLESFSSAGPATILFDDDGQRLVTPEERRTVDVVGPDGTNNTFFGNDIGFDADSAPNFFGTSAAAPHVAAVAALLLEKNPNLTLTEIYDALRNTAIDMGAAGLDDDSGFGLVDAAAALASIAGNVSNVPTPGDDVLTGDAQANVIDGLAGDDQISGLQGDDTLLGGIGDDILDGGEDDDRLFADAGADTLIGGPGADVLNGGAGADAMTGGEGDDRYIVDDAGDTTTENPGEGEDIVISTLTHTLAANIEILNLAGSGDIDGTGNGLDNVIRGNGGANVLSGGEGDDRLFAGGGADTLTGGLGADVLNGGGGADVMTGGEGDDRYIVDDVGDTTTENAGEGDDTVIATLTHTLAANIETLNLAGVGDIDGTGNGLDNVIRGNSGANTLSGGDGADRLFADAGADILIGGAGADVLNGGAGADAMTGGDGNDRYIVDDVGDTTTENPGEGEDTVIATLTHTLAANIEILSLAGSGDIDGTGNALDNIIRGNGGANTLSGGDGDDRLFAGAGVDTLIGGSGADILNGGGGADVMTGGDGDDRYIVDDVGDTTTENAGEGDDAVVATVSHTLAANVETLFLSGSGDIDGTGNELGNLIHGNGGANTLSGGDGDDRLFADAGADTLIGGLGSDVLNGGGGADAMTGGDGDDRYIVDDAGDKTTENAGEGDDTVISTLTHALSANIETLVLAGASDIDGTGNALANLVLGNGGANTLSGGDSADTLQGLSGDDVLLGEDGDDRLVGEAGADDLAGGEGADVLIGGDGADVFDGGAGQDQQFGGADGDRFVFNAVAETAQGAGDEIMDFETGLDQIDLSGIDAVAGGADDAFTVAVALSGTAGQLALTSLGGAQTRLEFDVDGDGVADGEILVTGPIVAADLVL